VNFTGEMALNSDQKEVRTMLAKAFAAFTATLGLSISIAAAEVVCNEEGDCWRVKERVEYKPELRLQIHPDGWRWQESEKDRYRWRDAPAGKRGGYWRQAVWIELD
jgi:hypothetical protein